MRLAACHVNSCVLNASAHMRAQRPCAVCTGCIPGNALAFLTLYLQLLGMSDLAASCSTVAFLVGQAFGASRVPSISTVTPSRLYSELPASCAY